MSDQEKESKQFSFDTITDFDKHINQSIPNYDVMFSSIVRLSDYFKDERKVIYDVGCSTGNLLRYFKRVNGYNGKMIGLDISRNLLPQNTREYDNIDFVEHNLNEPYSFNNACIVFSMYALQFIDKDARRGVLQRIYDGLCDGGALFIAEKVYLETGLFQDMFTSTYYDYKKQSFTEKEIFDKERALRTMLKPLTELENEKMLVQAGFHPLKIQKFYQYFQFNCWLCVKG